MIKDPTIYVDVTDNVEVLIVTKSKASPVDLKFMKNYMKVDIDTDDELIGKLIRSAVEMVENYCAMSIMVRTLEAIFTGVDYWKELPIYPANDISEVKTVLIDGTERILTTDEYQVMGGTKQKQVHTPVVMSLSAGRQTTATHVTYQSGYKDNSFIPMPVLEAIWLLVTMSYQQRDLLNNECVTISGNSELKRRLAPYKKDWL